MSSRDNLSALAIRKVKRYSVGTYEAFREFTRDCISIQGGDDQRGDTAVIPFHWWAAQEKLAAALCDSELFEFIVDKPRQMGATWTVADWFLYRALFWYGHEYRITSVGEDEATKALRKVKFMIEHLPEWCRPTLEVDNTTTIKIAETGSWITAIPATANAGRGDTLNGLLCDEAAYQVYAKEIIRSARPALEKRHGKLAVVSTMESGTYFAEEYVKAQQGKNGYKPFFFDCWADPNRDQGWYDRLLRKHGQEFMSSNYPRTWQESLLASGRPYFSQKNIQEDIEKEDLPYQDGFIDGGKFIPRVEGLVRVWRHPVKMHKYAIFADVSEGLEKGDWSNAYVMDAETRDIMARVRGKIPVGEYADVLMQTGEYYGCGDGVERQPALLAVEANNMGIAVTKHCSEALYRNMYMERILRPGKDYGKLTGRIGWMTSQGQTGTRGLMLGKLQTEYAMRRVAMPDRECLEEMALFAHLGPRGMPQAPPGKHDDCVMSFAGVLTICTFEAPYEQEGVGIWDTEEGKALGLRPGGLEYHLKRDLARITSGQKQREMEEV